MCAISKKAKKKNRRRKKKKIRECCLLAQHMHVISVHKNSLLNKSRENVEPVSSISCCATIFMKSNRMRQINKTLYYPIWYKKTVVVVLQCNRQCHPAVDALSCHKRIINSVSFCIAFELWARISYSEQSPVNLSKNNVSATRIEFSANESWLVFMHSQMASTQCFFFFVVCQCSVCNGALTITAQRKKIYRALQQNSAVIWWKSKTPSWMPEIRKIVQQMR